MLADLKKSLHTFMLYLRVRFWQFKRFLRENFTAEGRADRDLAESFEKARESDFFIDRVVEQAEGAGHIPVVNYTDRTWSCTSCGYAATFFGSLAGVCTGPRKTLSPRLQQAVDRMNEEDKKLLEGFGDGRFAQLVSAAEAAAKVPAFYSHMTRVDSFPKAVKKTKSAKKRVAKKKSKSNKKAKK